MTTAHDGDRQLVERIALARDERALGLLYDRHIAAMYRLALRLTAGDASAAQDIVHDAWVLAIPRLTAFEWRSRLSTWLCGFVVNVARTVARSALRDVALDERIESEDVALTGTFDRVDLERALASLPHGYREVLVLHDVEGFTHEEIASLLGVTSGTSKSQLSRARAAIRRALHINFGETHV